MFKITTEEKNGVIVEAPILAPLARSASRPVRQATLRSSSGTASASPVTKEHFGNSGFVETCQAAGAFPVPLMGYARRARPGRGSRERRDDDRA